MLDINEIDGLKFPNRILPHLDVPRTLGSLIFGPNDAYIVVVMNRQFYWEVEIFNMEIFKYVGYMLQPLHTFVHSDDFRFS